MMYEFKVSEMADEFGVHRNTIRNWINSGKISAVEGPGRKYIMDFEEYNRLCEKFGRQPLAETKPNEHVQTNIREKVVESSPIQGIMAGAKTLYKDPSWADSCLTCGTCASACPISGIDGLDPRKIVRMAFLGLEEELIASDWAWKCTLCSKCENVCPMNIEIVNLMQSIRASRPKELVPGPLTKGIITCLERGNNLGIPKQDYLSILETLGKELAAENCKGFETPIDVHGARVLVTVNSKDIFAEADNLKWWWKIFHAAKESWTLSSENWEGVNWGIFTGDDESVKTVVGRIVDNMRRLKCKVLLLPECGHAYYATRYGLNRWYPETLNEFSVVSVFDLLLEYIRDMRIEVDNTLHLQMAAYHDACNYGRKSQKAFGQSYYEEGRLLTRACCPNTIELEPTRETNYCCGAGGGAWASPLSDVRVFYGRMKARQIAESQAKLVVVACHNCRDQLKKSLNKEFNLGIEVRYLWELVADSLVLVE